MNIKETIRAEIERRIEMNKTKRGFPAGTYCAIRIGAYEHLLNFLDTLTEQLEVGDEYSLQIGKCTHTLRVGSTSDIDRLMRHDKEQKTELRESEDERIRKELWEYFHELELSSDRDFSPSFTIDDILAWLEKQKEQKPAEWSEEDEENFKWFDKLFRAESTVIGGRDIPQDKYLWFKSLRPQPKQVWTEEDDRICHLIMANLSESARHAITLPMETVNDFNNWLRTLQCMPPVFTDWNEEDQTLLSDALGCITMVQELKKRGKLKNFHISCSYDELRSWIRSLKSRPRKQPSWKPSEEQIDRLFSIVAALRKDYCDDMADFLASLYKQLKKLM
jgi:hypothetical protein